MKKFFVILIALLMVNGAMAQWFYINPADSSYYYAVYFTDASTGYVTNWSNILKTTDGGINWIPQYTNDWYLSALHFPDANTGYAIQIFGYPYFSSSIVKTTNGGSDWIEMAQFSEELFSLFFTDVNTGYAVGGVGTAGVIYKTSNGGANWIKQVDGQYSLRSVFFIDANTGYAVGGHIDNLQWDYHRYILKTTDGGLNWITIMLNADESMLTSVFFTSSDTGYAAGGDIIKTVDGGTNWINLSTETHYYESLWFTDANTGFAVGGSISSPDGYFTIIKTTDGGTNWFVQTVDGEPFKGGGTVFFPVTDTGYVISDRGILKTENGGGLPVGIGEQNKNANILTVYPNPASTTITISKPTTPYKNIFMTIYNIDGQQLITRQITEQETVVDVARLPQGVYFVRIKDDRTVKVGKFVKQRIGN